VRCKFPSQLLDPLVRVTLLGGGKRGSAAFSPGEADLLFKKSIHILLSFARFFTDHLNVNDDSSAIIKKAEMSVKTFTEIP
jgi:hypothetical protein